MNLRHFATCLLLAMLALAQSPAASAAPPVTTIQDTLYKADGSPFEGIVMINWQTFEASDTSNIPTNTMAAQVVGGSLYLKLVPTTTAPTAAYYSVRYVADGAVQFSELWSVPPSDSPLRVRDVRILWPPSAGGTAESEGTVEIGDVNGLTEALDLRPTKGISYLPSRAAVISGTGEIEGAAGSLTDCVRVDGTTGPCGGLSVGFVEGETPSGTIDGVNTSFTLAAAPIPASSLRLYRNGVLQAASVDYNLSGSTITFLSASKPFSGDLLRATYRTTAP